MIQANELRIGNWVECDGEVFQSTSYTPLIIERGEKKINPIPITQELLEKIEVISKRNGYPYSICGFYIIENLSHFSIKYFDISIELKGLHNLQNIYFALTGKELNYKP